MKFIIGGQTIHDSGDMPPKAPEPPCTPNPPRAPASDGDMICVRFIDSSQPDGKPSAAAVLPKLGTLASALWGLRSTHKLTLSMEDSPPPYNDAGKPTKEDVAREIAGALGVPLNGSEGVVDLAHWSKALDAAKQTCKDGAGTIWHEGRLNVQLEPKEGSSTVKLA